MMELKPTSSKFHWGSYPLNTKVLQWQLGELSLSCQVAGSEIRIAATYGTAITENPDSVNEIDDNLWHRWTLKKMPKEVVLRPALPPFPVVVTPEQTFQLVAGLSTVIYIGVPIWIQLLAGDILLFDGPARQLSKTWFGNFMDGEMCYWVSTAANTIPDPLIDDPLHCICPVDISNKSDEPLQMEKVCLRTTNLSLYLAADSLWSNHTRAKYTGSGSGSDIDVTNGPPKEAKKANLITAARGGKAKGFSAKTFATLKDIPGLGLF